jgi:hypothetical protein
MASRSDLWESLRDLVDAARPHAKSDPYLAKIIAEAEEALDEDD